MKRWVGVWLACVVCACGAEAPAAVGEVSQEVARLDFKYFGGDVISNPKIYVVWWGDLSRHSTEATAKNGGAEDFARAVVNSPYLEWLAMYHTLGNANAGPRSGKAGTMQLPGRGTFAGSLVLDDEPKGDVAEEKLQNALESVFAKKRLPPPDRDSLYWVIFPDDVGVRHDNHWSCGAWTSYHDAYTSKNGAPVRLIASVECGSSLRKLTAFTSMSLLAAITNPDGQGWSTAKGEEISGPCQFLSRVLTSTVGNFPVQGGYDTLAKNCTVSRTEKNDFALSLSPNAVARSSKMSVTVETQTVSGAAKTLDLFVTAPAGVTATLAKTTLTSGDTTTLTITTAPGTPVSDEQVVVQAIQHPSAKSLPHSAAVVMRH